METVTQETPPTEPEPVEVGDPVELEKSDDPVEPEESPVGQLLIPGSVKKVSSVVGGEAPTSSSLRVTGRKIEIEGEFKKGQKLTVELEIEVRGVGFDDQVDRFGTVIGCERKQRGEIVGIQLKRH